MKSPKSKTLSVAKNLSGLRILLIGGTGFLGKVWLSLVLKRFPDIGHIYLIVRSRQRSDGTIRQSHELRFWSEVATSPALNPLREGRSAKKFQSFINEKITVLDGDVTRPFGGISDEIRDEIRGKVDVLVNSSGVVDFNPPLDKSLEVNAFGMQNLVALAKDLGDIPFMHTSTCYVAGDRTGQVDEINPLSFPFPKADELALEHWDPEREIAECMEMVRHAKTRATDAFRQSDFLDTARNNLKKKGEPTRGSALEDELKSVKRKWIEKQLVDEGTERAQFWGWHNIYTYTKSIGEQILCNAGLRFTIVRPAVIESSVEFPLRGWNEGINTSAPLIYLINQGPLGVPAGEDSVLDVIPVDQVAYGMVLSLAELMEGTHKVVYQYGSSDTMPLKMYRLIELVSLHKRMYQREKGGLSGMIQQRIEAVPISVLTYKNTGPKVRSKQIRGFSKYLKPFAGGALSSIVDPALDSLEGLAKGLDITAKITDQFVPFTATHNYRFSTLHTKHAYERLSEEEQKLLPWQPHNIDWHDYLLNIHCPGLVENVFPLIEDKKKKEKKPLRHYDHLLDLLDEVAERYEHIPALMRTHEEGFSRISFRDFRKMAFGVAETLRREGVSFGDRILISAENHPHWAIVYFGIISLGAIAVPLDVALTPPQALIIEASANAKMALFDEEAVSAFGHVLEVPIWDLHKIVEESALVETLSERPSLEVDSIASILYTSGTTGDPKGVMLSHGNFTAMLGSLGQIFSMSSQDRVLSVLPLHHTFEFSCGLLMPLSQGTGIIYLDEITGDRLSYGLREGQVTAMVGVPALWQLLERRIKTQISERGTLFEALVDAGLELNRRMGKSTKLDLGKLFFAPIHNRLGGNIRYLVSGGAALPPDTHKFYSGLGLHLSEGYGLTEAAPVLTFAKGGPGVKSGTVGKSIPGVKVKIMNPDESGIGEVWAKGSNIMQGYFNNPDATQQSIEEEGWLRTGDMGKIDHNDRLQLVGRAKEVVVTAAGENIYLDDVENTIGNIRYIKEYVLVGISDNRGGERLGMLAVLDEEGNDNGEKLSKKELQLEGQDAIKKAVDKLPQFQRPAVIHMVDADLPRTRTRKIKRKESRQILEKIIIATAVVSKDKSSEGVSVTIVKAIASVTGSKVGDIHSATMLREDLGFDSLMAVELASVLSNIGKGRFDADDIAKCETISDLVDLVGLKGEMTQEEKEDEKKVIPELIAQPLKAALGMAQYEFYGSVMKTRVIGQANIPQNRPVIVVSNHCSHLDMGLVKYALGKYGRKLVALAAKDYFFEGNPWVVAYFEQLTNLEPIDRQRGYRASLRQAIEVVDGGNIVLLFPEGTRRIDGVIGEFKPLVGQLALETDVDILPLFLDGTFESMPKGAILPKRRSVTVHIGSPISTKLLKTHVQNKRISQSARIAARMAQHAVESLRDGTTFNFTQKNAADWVARLELQNIKKQDPVDAIKSDLQTRFDPQRVKKSLTWYFTLDGTTGPRFHVEISKETISIKEGKPAGSADCVVKTSVEMLRKIVQEGYTPAPPEFMSGSIKTNQIPLLIELQTVFNLKEPIS